MDLVVREVKALPLRNGEADVVRRIRGGGKGEGQRSANIDVSLGGEGFLGGAAYREYLGLEGIHGGPRILQRHAERIRNALPSRHHERIRPVGHI